ncbi:uncharacterized protein LOC117122756 [Anneissia japonica]|uniref:uncharacterized protein LOC117122756 n=1 Tax=Anneissia japonica TaxID=1529436 RepID=UPI001425A762|nr:uncharacterized protein LOC117122756 [Anneissia japonica]
MFFTLLTIVGLVILVPSTTLHIDSVASYEEQKEIRGPRQTYKAPCVAIPRLTASQQQAFQTFSSRVNRMQRKEDYIYSYDQPIIEFSKQQKYAILVNYWYLFRPVARPNIVKSASVNTFKDTCPSITNTPRKIYAAVTDNGDVVGVAQDLEKLSELGVDGVQKFEDVICEGVDCPLPFESCGCDCRCSQLDGYANAVVYNYTDVFIARIYVGGGGCKSMYSCD